MGGSRTSVGRYEIVREIGRGGMASVYLARQRDLDREVALKELRELARLDPSFTQRFLREAKLAGGFRHPNIVTVHDYFEHHRVPYIAMEYLANGSLRPYVGRVTLAQVGGVLEGLLAGLAQAEQHGVVHRDIKPENLLVTDDGGIKIADFGIARAAHQLETNAMLTAVGTTVGTPNYIAPEQAMAGHVGPWTDLYSVGLTTFELLVGRTPFGDTEEPMGVVLRQIQEPVPKVSDLAPHVHPHVSDWVGWLVSKSPGDRPASARQAWEALEETLIGTLGPRWRRGASLLPTAGMFEEVRGRSRDLGAAPAAVAVGPLAGWPTHAPRATAARLASTIPPRERVGVAPAADTKRSRVPLRVKLAVVLMSLLVVAAIALNSGTGGGLTPVTEEVPGARPKSSTSSPTASTAPSSTSSLSDQVEPARSLARSYDQSAAQIAKQSSGGPLSAADASLVKALRQTADDYRAAADAADRDDLAGYTAALAAAETSSQVVQTLMGESPGGGATPPTQGVPVPATPSASESAPPKDLSCAGDSVSDDPSDDECNE